MSNLTPEDVEQLVSLVHLTLTDLHEDRKNVCLFDAEEYSAETGENGYRAKHRMLKRVDDSICCWNETLSRLEKL